MGSRAAWPDGDGFPEIPRSWDRSGTWLSPTPRGRRLLNALWAAPLLCPRESKTIGWSRFGKGIPVYRLPGCLRRVLLVQTPGVW